MDNNNELPENPMGTKGFAFVEFEKETEAETALKVSTIIFILYCILEVHLLVILTLCGNVHKVHSFLLVLVWYSLQAVG